MKRTWPRMPSSSESGGEEEAEARTPLGQNPGLPDGGAAATAAAAVDELSSWERPENDVFADLDRHGVPHAQRGQLLVAGTLRHLP